MKVYVLQIWQGDYFHVEGVYASADAASEHGASLIEQGITDESVVTEFTLGN